MLWVAAMDIKKFVQTKLLEFTLNIGKIQCKRLHYVPHNYICAAGTIGV